MDQAASTSQTVKSIYLAVLVYSLVCLKKDLWTLHFWATTAALCV